MNKWLVLSLALFLTPMLNAKDLSEITILALDGKPMDLGAFKGKVVLFVNVASKCGFTKQYTGLEKLYTDMKGQGLVIVGVPSNDFGGQEPGSSEEIATFCSTKFNVDFPLTEKVVVKGAEKHPLYAFLTEGRGEPKWNFHKYLVDKNGKVVGEFPSKIAPESPELLAAISTALSGS